MDTIVLGRTGLEVNVAGLGTATNRVGKRSGLTGDEGIAIVRQGVDVGITLIDSAEGYGIEEIVGKGIQHVDRSSLVGAKNPEHLRSNLSYLAMPAFPEPEIEKRKHIFRNAHPGN